MIISGGEQTEKKTQKRSPDEAAQALLAALGKRKIQRQMDDAKPGEAKPPEAEIAPKQAQEGSKGSKGMGKSSKRSKAMGKGSKGSKAPKTPGRLQIKPFR